MELPWFGRVQPGDTYYYTPLTVNNLGIVDTYDDTLYAHVYHEGQAKKGGNNVASLLIKQLIYLGWMDGNYLSHPYPLAELNVFFDNCPGQNKNNHVLRLVPYLVEIGVFQTVNFNFLVAGHTKNVCDWMFNLMKARYRQSQAHSMKELVELLQTTEKVIVLELEENDMKDYDKYLQYFYRRLPKVENLHCFECKKHHPSNNEKEIYMTIRRDSLEDAPVIDFNVIKRGFKGRDNYPKGTVGMIQAVANRKRIMEQTEIEVLEAPGINPYKQVELFRKYRCLIDEKVQDITCPEPSKEVFELVEKEVDYNKKKKAQKKVMMIDLKKNICNL